MNVEISYNLESVSVLEEIADALKELANGEAEALNGGSFLIGAYLGEIVRRALAGQWVEGANMIVRTPTLIRLIGTRFWLTKDTSDGIYRRHLETCVRRRSGPTCIGTW